MQCVYIYIYISSDADICIYVKQVQPRNQIGQGSSDLAFRGQVVKSNRTELCLDSP